MTKEIKIHPCYRSVQEKLSSQASILNIEETDEAHILKNKELQKVKGEFLKVKYSQNGQEFDIVIKRPKSCNEVKKYKCYFCKKDLYLKNWDIEKDGQPAHDRCYQKHLESGGKHSII